MSALLWWLSAWAWAGALDTERAREHIAGGRFDDALAAARAGIDAAEDLTLSYLTWLQACEGAGIGPACRAELAVAAESDPALDRIRLWHDRRTHQQDVDVEGDTELDRAARGELDAVQLPAAVAERLALLARRDPDAVASVALATLQTQIDHPDVVMGVFDPSVPAGAGRAKLVRQVGKQARKALPSASPQVLYRWLRLLRAAGLHELAAQAADRLAQAGEARPADRLTPSAAEQRALANRVAAGQAELPASQPAIVRSVALNAAADAADAGRPDTVVQVLTSALELAPDPSLAVALAEHHLSAGDAPAALAAAQHALDLASLPWPDDQALADRPRRRQALADSLAVRGAAHALAGAQVDAVTDLMLANQLAAEPLRVAQLEQLMRVVLPQLEQVRDGLQSRQQAAFEVALARAATSAEADDHPQVIALTDDAVRTLIIPSHRKARLSAALPGRAPIASALALRARSLHAVGRVDAARSDLYTAIALAPFDAPAGWWALLGEWVEGDAGRFAKAMADSLDAETPAPDAWGAALVTGWMAGHGDTDAPPVSIQRGRVIELPRRGGSARGGGGGGGGGDTVRAATQQGFPRIRTADGGQVKLAVGRLHLITVVRADSPSSRRLLGDLGGVATRLRQRGIDVALIAISADAERAAYERLAAERGMWGALVWAPELPRQMGLTALPTTWVVDRDGVLRYTHVGYLGPDAYERELRVLSAR